MILKFAAARLNFDSYGGLGLAMHFGAFAMPGFEFLLFLEFPLGFYDVTLFQKVFLRKGPQKGHQNVVPTEQVCIF